MDFGIGDAVVPEPDEVRLPTLIDGVPAPRIRAYPRVVAVAEKVEAMVALGRRNSRMKDFHDVWDLSEAFASIRQHSPRRRGRRSTDEGHPEREVEQSCPSRIGLVIGSGNVRPDAWKEASTSSTTSQSSWYNRMGSLP